MRRSLYLFSNDLRIDDNPALNKALSAEEHALLYFRDLGSPHCAQGALGWWLDANLRALESELATHGLRLNYLSGNSIEAVTTLLSTQGFNELCVARAYTPSERENQKQLHQWCAQQGVAFKRFPGALLFEPEQVKNKQGAYYKVFTPFYKACMQLPIRDAQCSPLASTRCTSKPINIASEKLDDWHLQPQQPNWAETFVEHWRAGAGGAQLLFEQCRDQVIDVYDDERNNMSEPSTSRMSAYLNLGLVSPARIWRDTLASVDADKAQGWLRQLIWREFNYHLMFHEPKLLKQPFQAKFAHYPWQNDSRALSRWQRGQTGYPIVDAAMNELWTTGWMHNRARMIVASFLTKHLQIHWSHGADWFWDTLIDADLPNNIGGWQWTAGCGADAAPYFRIFNPITQGQKFDKQGLYVRRWLPILKDLPDKYLFSPWECPADILREAGVELGKNYPLPIVDHKAARERALATYANCNT